MSWQVSLVRPLICLWLIWTATGSAAAEGPQPQLTISQMEIILLPPLGWKVDREVLKTHFWSICPPIFAGEEETSLTVYPFWPAFYQLEVKDAHIEERTPGRYQGELGKLLSSGLKSTNPVIQKKSQLWLHQSLILYFTGFRLSRLEGQRPYAPWIKPKEAKQLDQMTDEYVARQKVIRAGNNPTVEVTDHLLAGWMASPPSSTLADIVGYYDVLEANHDWLSVDYTYPISWTWLRGTGNKKLVARTGIDNDLYGFHTHWLPLSTLPSKTNDPVRLWLRDVYLCYIAGKELLEGKQLLLEDKASEPLLKEALQQWWAGLEKQP